MTALLRLRLRLLLRHARGRRGPPGHDGGVVVAPPTPTPPGASHPRATGSARLVLVLVAEDCHCQFTDPLQCPSSCSCCQCCSCCCDGGIPRLRMRQSEHWQQLRLNTTGSACFCTTNSSTNPALALLLRGERLTAYCTASGSACSSSSTVAAVAEYCCIESTMLSHPSATQAVLAALLNSHGCTV